MLKGHTYSLQTFTNEAFRKFIDTFLNHNNGVVLGCALSNTNASVTIGEGYFVVAGGFLQVITSETVNVSDNGFYSLVCEIDLTKTNTTVQLNQVAIKAIKGVSNYPTLSTTDTLYQYEFARFKVENGSITNFTDRRTYINIQSIYNSIEDETGELIQQIQEALANVLDGSAYLLKTGGIINGNLSIEGNLTAGNIGTIASKNYTYGTNTPSGGSNGDIYDQYFN